MGRFIDVGQEAVGVIAIGQAATGVIAFGQAATGVVAVGQLARGVFVVGQLALGLATFGQLSIGLLWSGGMVGTGLFNGPGMLIVPLRPWGDTGSFLSSRAIALRAIVFGIVLVIFWLFAGGPLLHDLFQRGGPLGPPVLR